MINDEQLDRLVDPDNISDIFEEVPRLSSMTVSYEDVGQEDVVYYDVHCDLNKVHRMVKSKFVELHSKVPSWKLELKRLRERIGSVVNSTNRRELDNRISVLEQLLKVTEGPEYLLWREYLERSKDILVKYDGMSKDEPTHDLVYQYNEIIRDYSSIVIIRRIEHDYTLCPNCKNPRMNSSGTVVCPDCGITDTLVSKECYQSTGRKHVFIQKNQYLTRDNFMKGLYRYQGKISRKLPYEMFDRMDEYAERYEMPTSSEVKKMDLSADGRRGPREYTRSYMKSLLITLGYKPFLNDINLILHLYWGWTLPDVTHLESQIKEDYENSQAVFNEIQKDRQSCLILPYRLYRHLRKVGYPCKIDDFDIVSTPEIRQSYESIWKEICDKLGWDFEPL